jgi:hypothetical protein
MKRLTLRNTAIGWHRINDATNITAPPATPTADHTTQSPQ